jgi:hypothetical protein
MYLLVNGTKQIIQEAAMHVLQYIQLIIKYLVVKSTLS